MKNTEQNYNFQPDQKVAIMHQRVIIADGVVRRVTEEGIVLVERRNMSMLQRYKQNGMTTDVMAHNTYIEPWDGKHQKAEDRGRLVQAVADSLEEIEYGCDGLDDKDLRRLHLALKHIEDTILREPNQQQPKQKREK